MAFQLLGVLRNFLPGLKGAVGSCENAEGLIRHLFIFTENLFSFRVVQIVNLSVLHIAVAAGEEHIRRALAVLYKVIAVFVNGTHHLPGGIEGRLKNSGHVLQDLILVEEFLSVGYQSSLCGLALNIAVMSHSSVIAEAHGAGQEFLVPVVVHNSHPVLGEGSGFVGADNLGTAQCLHRGQLADDGLPFGHPGNADGKLDSDNGGQSLGNSGYSKRDSQHEGVHNDRPAEVMSAEQGEGEDEYTDGQHADAENL